MTAKKASILDYTEVLKGLRQLRSHPGLSDFAPLLFLFVALKVWFAMLIEVVESVGGKSVRVGTRFDDPIPIEKLNFYNTISRTNNVEVPTAVDQSDIAVALNAAYPGYIPDLFSFTAEPNPVMGWIFFAFVTLGYLIPGGYALYSFLVGSVPNWCRHSLQVLVAVAGVFWICAMFANGITVKNPVQSVGSAGFWVMHGALCLHLFTDNETKLRRYLPPTCLAALAFSVLAANDFDFSAIFFGREIPFETEVAQLNATALSGLWSSLHGFLRNPGSATMWLVIIGYVAVSTTYTVFEKRLAKISPFLNLAIVTVSIATLIFVLMAMLGMRINAPANTLGTQALLFVGGAFFLSYATRKIQTSGASRTLLDAQIERIERKTTRESST